MPAMSSASAASAGRAGAQPSSERARAVSITGARKPMSTQPAGEGCTCAFHARSASVRSGRSGTFTRRAPSTFAIRSGVSTGSAAML